jgi:hypothetical protein
MPLIFVLGTHKSDFPQYLKINFWRGHFVEIYLEDAIRGRVRDFPCRCSHDLAPGGVCIQHCPWYDRLLGRTCRGFL